MRRYELSYKPLVEELLSGINLNTEDKQIYTVSGYTIMNNEVSAVMEYYEIDESEKVTPGDFKEINELYGSKVLSLALNIPLFIIIYKQGSDKFIVYNYTENTKSELSIIKDNNESEFVSWWKQYKNSYQVSPIMCEHEEWKINSVLNSEGLKWGGDLDGVVIKDGKISSIVEVRKSSGEKIEHYNPADYFKGTNNGWKGDYGTWKPLIKLRDELQVPLYLVTISEVDRGIYGITEVDNITNKELSYVKGILPGHNVYNNLKDLTKIL